jgi:hypothetical protein
MLEEEGLPACLRATIATPGGRARCARVIEVLPGSDEYNSSLTAVMMPQAHADRFRAIVLGARHVARPGPVEVSGKIFPHRAPATSTTSCDGRALRRRITGAPAAR